MKNFFADMFIDSSVICNPYWVTLPPNFTPWLTFNRVRQNRGLRQPAEEPGEPVLLTPK